MQPSYPLTSELRQILLAALLVSLVLLGLVFTGTGVVAISPGDAQWTSTGGPWSPGGNVRLLTVDPAAAGTAYAVVEAAGINTVHRTVDRAANWTAVSSFSTETPTALAVRGSVAYVGHSDVAPGQPAILLSIDGATNWAPAHTAVVTTTVHSIAISPQATSTAYAVAQAGDNGVVLSTTNGLQWTPVFTVAGDITELAINPITPLQLFVGAQNATTSQAEVYRSNDSGDNWERVLDSTERLEPFLLVHPVTPTIVFALTRPPGCCPPFPAHLWRSDDSGDTWNIVSTGALFSLIFAAPDTIYSVHVDVDYTNNASAANPTWVHVGDNLLPELTRSIAVDDRDGHLLYAGLVSAGVYTSTNGGASFQMANNGIRSYLLPHSIVIDPQANSTVYAATDSGGYKSVNGGANWTQSFALCKTMDFAVQPGNSDVVLAGAAETSGGKPAIYRSVDGGAQWTAVHTPARPWGYNGGYALAFDPQRPEHAYAITGSESPGSPTENEVLRSEDAGLGWTVVLTSAGSYPGLDVLEVASDSTIYIAGTEGWYGSSWPGVVYRSTDHGDNWTRVYSEPVSSIIGLAIDPQRADTLYIIDNANHLFKSTDRGDSWTNIYTTTRTLKSLTHDTSASDHLFLGLDGPTVLASSDGGRTWSELAGWAGFVAPQLSSLTVDYGPDTRTLYAGLNGVWARSYPTPSRYKIYLPEVLTGF